MNRFTSAIAAVALLATPVSAAQFAERGSFRRPVQIYYASSWPVQRAVYRDACLGGDQLIESHTARNRLRRSADRVAYDRVADALGAVYARVVEPTDANLEQVARDFCRATKPATE
jgi:hypothetical protein